MLIKVYFMTCHVAPTYVIYDALSRCHHVTERQSTQVDDEECGGLV